MIFLIRKEYALTLLSVLFAVACSLDRKDKCVNKQDCISGLTCIDGYCRSNPKTAGKYSESHQNDQEVYTNDTVDVPSSTEDTHNDAHLYKKAPTDTLSDAIIDAGVLDSTDTMTDSEGNPKTESTVENLSASSSDTGPSSSESSAVRYPEEHGVLDAVVEVQQESEEQANATPEQISQPTSIEEYSASPKIHAIDGDGSEKSIVDIAGVLNSPGEIRRAQHRLREALMITGESLDTVSQYHLQHQQDSTVQFGEQEGLRFEQGGTSMQRKLLLPVSVIAGLYTLTLTNEHGTVSAQVMLLKGEAGDGLACDDTTCTVPDGKSLEVNGDITAKGSIEADAGTFGALTANDLESDTFTWFSDCPLGYEQDMEAPYTLCKKEMASGIYDEMVKVGDFWIDKYESSVWTNVSCNGTQLGVTSTWNVAPNGDWSGKEDVYACSRYSVAPSTYVTWFQAQQSCRASGKSLCTNAEWQAAAMGTPDPYVNADAPVEGEFPCNIWGYWSGDEDPGLLPRGASWAIEERSTLTGTAVNCISRVGANDMIGNVWEWVADWFVAGETWMSGEVAGTQPWGEGYNGDATWNVNGSANRGGGEYIDGLPAAARRGGNWHDGEWSGVYSMALGIAPNFIYLTDTGLRCCRRY